MKRIEIFTLIIIGLFYFSEGKPCPEKTRPHKTRCEAYYKCMELPTKRHVWVPEKCEQGLIYEPNLKMCVLPGDDWECTLGDAPNEQINNSTSIEKHLKSDDSHIINDNKREKEVKRIKEADIYIVNNENEDILVADEKADAELVLDTSMSNSDVSDSDNQYESSGDGGELVELDGFLQAEKRETDDHVMDKEEQQMEENETDPMKGSASTLASSSAASNIDPKLTEHLQRLSQLIDGLKQTYQNKDQEQTELRPDQLNAFLAHFNIKNKFNSLDPTASTPHISTTTPAATSVALERHTNKIDKIYQMPSKNKTLLQEHLSNKLKPETKVVLANTFPKRYATPGYSNSQIVVNRPEGSVLFSIPPYGNEAHFAEHSPEYSHSSPKISEDTLKTVLELSKQMIATQNVPKVIPNPAYYGQPILQPVFLPASAFPGNANGSPFSAYFNNNNQNNNNADYDDNDGKYGTQSSYSRPHRGNQRPQRPSSGFYSKPGTTIIHNNVIPVHVTSTNSGSSSEQDAVDSYGYPPLSVGDNGNNNSGGGYQTQSINHHHIHSHRFENNKFIASVTTVRPVLSTTTATRYVAAQYPSGYPSEISVTTSRPFEFQPTPSTVAEYYTPSPHLNENNANSLFQSSDRYPTMQFDSIPRPMNFNRPNPTQQPSSYYYSQNNPNSLFPAQIDPNKIQIRPNAQKFESMEMETDDIGGTSGGGGFGERPQLSYSYNNENKPDISNHYIDSNGMLSISSGNSHKNPYMPRPQSSGVSGGSLNLAIGSNKPKFPTFGSHTTSGYPDGTQLVNVGGNFISFDVFQNTILPLLGNSQSSINDLGNVEVITCAAGVRQPNNTDCTRYYVCSKKDGKVLSYSCPPYTAFNKQTRICDAYTYSVCTPDAISSSFTVSENKRIQLEAIKALQESKKRREQAMKTQNIANLLQQYGGHFPSPNIEEQNGSNEKDMLSAYMQQASAMAATTAKPSSAPGKKRKYYCKEGDKIADQTSINSYFVCYKNAQGMMRGHKMTCSKGLLFCPKTSMCTLSSKCA